MSLITTSFPIKDTNTSYDLNDYIVFENVVRLIMDRVKETSKFYNFKLISGRKVGSKCYFKLHRAEEYFIFSVNLTCRGKTCMIDVDIYNEEKTKKYKNDKIVNYASFSDLKEIGNQIEKRLNFMIDLCLSQDLLT